jgi:hypothetical protein
MSLVSHFRAMICRILCLDGITNMKFTGFFMPRFTSGNFFGNPYTSRVYRMKLVYSGFYFYAARGRSRKMESVEIYHERKDGDDCDKRRGP